MDLNINKFNIIPNVSETDLNKIKRKEYNKNHLQLVEQGFIFVLKDNLVKAISTFFFPAEV